MEKTIDCRGLACPLPVVNAKKEALQFTEDGTLQVRVDNEIAVQNLKKFATQRGFAAADEKAADNDYTVTMTITADALKQQEESPEQDTGKEGGIAIVLTSATMGTGDDTLGKTLMKAFLFALTSQDTVPAHIICYNGGAHLTCEGSESIEDLKHLEEAGCKITTCGTCLDFYGLKDKLRVGTVSNMYDIAETLLHAGSVLRP